MTRTHIAQSVLIAITSVVSLTRPGHAVEDAFLRSVSEIAAREAVKQLSGKSIAFSESGFSGHAKARNPAKNLGVEIKKFTLRNDALTIRLAARGVFELSGLITQGGSETKVDAVLELTLDVSAVIVFLEKQDDFIARPLVTDISLEVQVQSLNPANLSGGSKLISRIANQAFRKNKNDILKSINRNLGEHPIRL